MAHACEEPVTGQNCAWGTQRDNFHIWLSYAWTILSTKGILLGQMSDTQGINILSWSVLKTTTAMNA